MVENTQSATVCRRNPEAWRSAHLAHVGAGITNFSLWCGLVEDPGPHEVPYTWGTYPRNGEAHRSQEPESGLSWYGGTSEYAADLKSADREILGVQIPLPAPKS